MKKIILLLAVCIYTTYLCAQEKNYWKSIQESEANKTQDIWLNKFKPSAYKLFQLDEPGLLNALHGTPTEISLQKGTQGKTITIPDASGNFSQYTIAETALMQPQLAAKYPGIKTYIGKSADNSIIHLSITNSGLYAVITAIGKETFYINALDNKNNIYAVNARTDIDAAKGFKCSIDESIIKPPITSKSSKFTGNADDGKLYQYRLALCVNGEFSQFFLDGTEADTAAMKAKVMSALIVCLQKANAVYERDFGIRMIFVDNEDTLIFLDTAKDPWPATTSSTWNSKTQVTIDKRIGKNNYDIGHLLGKVPSADSNDGNAYCIGCVCDNTQKGSGYTGYYDPSLTDYMVIDYWTHELGHQFGANHTFTYVNEGSGANIEPGSGSTIMGYAGITGQTDVQPHSDDLFSVVSIAQNTTYIKSAAGGCAVTTPTGNHAPISNAGSDYTIPKSTPFVLTGTATDVDANDALSYIWEQVDIYQNGSNTYPKPKSKTGPLFKTYNYTTSPSRYFPDMNYILNGSLGWKWEVLSSITRPLDFRFTARDNHTGDGNNKSDEMTVNVDSTAGPFQITIENDNPETLHGNELKNITWDVNNTNAAPVNCNKVNILLSVDGGATFPITLAANTANDGTENIAIPNTGTTHARIKIEAVDNIFFTINNRDFTVEAVLPVTWLSVTAQKTNNTSVLLKWGIANEFNNKYYSVERSSDEAHFTSIGQVNASDKKTDVQQYSFTDSKALQGINYYRLKQVDADGYSSYSAIVRVLFTDNKNSWILQPNPAKTTTAFYANANMTNISLHLYNASGRQVYTASYSSINAGTKVSIPIVQFSKGIYFLKVKSGQEIRTEKLIIE